MNRASTRKKTTETEREVAVVFEKTLDVKFDGKRTLLRSDGGQWGRCDGRAELSEKAVLFLEVEAIQHHPEGNVAKYWPWLLENPKKRVLLIQAYTSDAVAPLSRRRVAAWLGKRMETSLRGRRFWYEFRVLDEKYRPKRVAHLSSLVSALK